jgi:hypothetical protein
MQEVKDSLKFSLIETIARIMLTSIKIVVQHKSFRLDPMSTSQLFPRVTGQFFDL